MHRGREVDDGAAVGKAGVESKSMDEFVDAIDGGRRVTIGMWFAGVECDVDERDVRAWPGDTEGASREDVVSESECFGRRAGKDKLVRRRGREGRKDKEVRVASDRDGVKERACVMCTV